MSQENVERLRLGYRHVARTGQMIPAEFAQPDFIWDTTTFRGVVLIERCIGVDQANQWLARWTEPFNDWSIEVEEIIDAGDQVVAIVHQRGTARHGGPEVGMRIAQVWTFRDGLAARMEMYADKAEALEAVGLRE